MALDRSGRETELHEVTALNAGHRQHAEKPVAERITGIPLGLGRVLIIAAML